jgi:hypothetical protein
MTHEIIDANELAKRLNLPESWIRSGTRERTPRDQRIPHLRLGRYVRFLWGDPELDAWLDKHRAGNGK